MASTAAQQEAAQAGDLTLLSAASHPNSSSPPNAPTARVYPTEDSILAVLQSRFRNGQGWAWAGFSHLVYVNPYNPANDSTKGQAGGDNGLEELAKRLYLVAKRTGRPQGLVARGITGSGKSTCQNLVMDHIIRMSSQPKDPITGKVAAQIRATQTILEAFGNTKGLMNPNASKFGRYTQLFFSPSHSPTSGQLAGAQILPFSLDKSRLTRLSHDERSFHIFYQFIAGATSSEREQLNIEDPSEYALLNSSGCFRLPSGVTGPLEDDASSMSRVRDAFRTLGIKSKTVSSILSLVIAILQLSNIQFSEGDASDVPAFIANPQVLDSTSRLLGVEPEDLAQALTTKSNYVRKELYSVILDKRGAEAQRDGLMRDLYAILFAYIVESANNKIGPKSDNVASLNQVCVLDLPGYQTRSPSSSGSFSGQLINNPYGQNGYEEFLNNFSAELLHSFTLRHIFDHHEGFNAAITADGIPFPEISLVGNEAAVELLRGPISSSSSARKPGGVIGLLSKSAQSFKSGKMPSEDAGEQELWKDMNDKFSVNGAYIAFPGPQEPTTPPSSTPFSLTSSSRTPTFGITHYMGQTTYSLSSFIRKDTDTVDPSLVTLLRGSREHFVGKLVGGPGLACEYHAQSQGGVVVRGQVISRPIRTPMTGAVQQEEAEDAAGWGLDENKTYAVSVQVNVTLTRIFEHLSSITRMNEGVLASRIWVLDCLRPNDSLSRGSFDKRRVKNQIRSLFLPSVLTLNSSPESNLVAAYDMAELLDRYNPNVQGSDEERLRQLERKEGWVDGRDYIMSPSSSRIWLSYPAWRAIEDSLFPEPDIDPQTFIDEETHHRAFTDETYGEGGAYGGSNDNLLMNGGYAGGGLNTPSQPDFGGPWSEWDRRASPSLSSHPQQHLDVPGVVAPSTQETKDIQIKEANNAVEEVPTSKTPRYWLWMVWACTFFIPSFLLRYLGRMKRPDIRLAWREKFTIFLLIFLFNGVVIFYIVEFGRLLCPDFNKAWSLEEILAHTERDNFWVAIQGTVYDVTDWINGQHSDITGQRSNTPDALDVLGGQDLTYYFPVPLAFGCSGLVDDDHIALQIKNFTASISQAMHTSGPLQSDPGTALRQIDWYKTHFLTRMDEFKKGPVVWDWDKIQSLAADETVQKVWAVYEGDLFDLTDYLYSIDIYSTDPKYKFLDSNIVDLFSQRSGQDITKPLSTVLAAMDTTTRQKNISCLKNNFFVGKTDFRKTPRCQTQNYILLIVSSILMGSVGLKFLAALQLGPKRNPELQDKFILCQVPCYTEGEESLRRTVDSLAALNYDDKRKLIFIICDGNIIGSGNDRTTPRIVLDILGVDPALDPEPLLFKSVGEGSRALNYGKVYSGLYEFEGHVVPYLVVVKVGKPTERSKPGNRGKRDSQILLLHFLNRVHFDAPMSPLELEIGYQMRNVIGIDPVFYEYIFTIDADTMVTPDSLNRLVASASDDSAIIGICGETKLHNEQTSWWTMIQVYEYYISHHLSKAFESLFGSVTCLPGCFSLYRIRTSDKGRPIIISNRIIDEYAEPNVDTLHKKNLFSLGEDRFLTTLLMKHFPTYKTKFCADAIAHTVAPESWRILFSQRRRWINSTVHNLCELVLLPELIGFCCFSMRFFVFIDLLSTLILPATTVYLVFLIVSVAIGSSPFPLISVIMIAVLYGLQAIIFILKREFMLVGWMVVYICSYPIYSFFLPVYSFWCMDEFSWGNTRLVVGEGKEKKVLFNEDEKFDESMIPLKKFSDYEADTWENGSHRSGGDGDSRSVSRSRGAPRSRDHSPHGQYNQASQSGDYYRDTNLTHNNSSNPNLRLGPGSQSNLSHHTGSHYGGVPQLPMMGLGGGSVAGGSDYGGPTASLSGFPMGPMPGMMPGMMGYQNTGGMGSVYGMPIGGMNVPRNTMMSFGPGMFGSGPLLPIATGGSQSGHGDSSLPPPSAPFGHSRPMSTFSVGTAFGAAANPNNAPSMNPNPTDEELYNALKAYLSVQDLMTVTKKTAREAIAARFPKADLSSRKDFLNQSIDSILSES